MPDVKGDKSGRTYKRYMNEAGTAREYTDDSGKKMTDAEFKAAEGGFTESAGNTTIGGKDRSGTQRVNSSGTAGRERVKPVDEPVIREEEETGLAGAAARERRKKQPSAGAQAKALIPSPTPTPKSSSGSY